VDDSYRKYPAGVGFVGKRIERAIEISWRVVWERKVGEEWEMGNGERM
jgi:hypothetical protein